MLHVNASTISARSTLEGSDSQVRLYNEATRRSCHTQLARSPHLWTANRQSQEAIPNTSAIAPAIRQAAPAEDADGPGRARIDLAGARRDAAGVRVPHLRRHHDAAGAAGARVHAPLIRRVSAGLKRTVGRLEISWHESGRRVP